MFEKTYIIIPARYASTRFAGKPLVDIKGKTMIQRVIEQANKVDKNIEVVVATDDERILNHVLSLKAKAVMTGSHHQSGTDRCAEVAQILKIPENAIIVNLQGDEPFIKPEQIRELLSCFEQNNTQIATLIKAIDNFADLQNPNVVKAVVSKTMKALYFSRQPLPYFRNRAFENWLNTTTRYYKHIGIYAFRTKTLRTITQLPLSPLEITEGLEQLRWLENDYEIQTKITSFENIAIDTPQDLEAALKFL